MAKDTPYLDVQQLTKSFGSLVLFRNISFSIAEGQKVGLIAKNGTGKSTLLSILSGIEGYDTGEIIFRRDLRVGMLEQSPAFDPEESVLDACFKRRSSEDLNGRVVTEFDEVSHQEEDEKVLKAKQILTKLKVRDLSQPMGQLSGGQQKRVALANVLITEPDLLILDEPTNHLDLEMIEWLEGYLNLGWDAFNARTETGEAYHYTHPVSSRSAGCPLLDPSDCLAHLAGHGVSSDGALLLQSRIKNVQMLKVSATALLCIQFPKFLHPELSVFVFGCLLQFSVTSVPLVCPYNSRFEIRFVDCARPIAIGLTQTVFMGFSVLPQGSSYSSDQEPCSILQRLIPPCSRGSQDKLHRLGRPFSADRQTYG